MKLQIREIHKRELYFLNEMLYEALFVEKGQPKLSKNIIKEAHLSKYIESFGTKKLDVCFVALVDEKLIGACWGRLFNKENKGYGFINSKTPELSIAITRNFRNKGIGTSLIHKLIDTYKILNVKAISLSVYKNNSALKLYKKVGFKIEKESDTSVIMCKEI